MAEKQGKRRCEYLIDAAQRTESVMDQVMFRIVFKILTEKKKALPYRNRYGRASLNRRIYRMDFCGAVSDPEICSGIPDTDPDHRIDFPSS